MPTEIDSLDSPVFWDEEDPWISKSQPIAIKDIIPGVMQNIKNKKGIRGRYALDEQDFRQNLTFEEGFAWANFDFARDIALSASFQKIKKEKVVVTVRSYEQARDIIDNFHFPLAVRQFSGKGKNGQAYSGVQIFTSGPAEAKRLCRYLQGTRPTKKDPTRVYIRNVNLKDITFLIRRFLRESV